MHSFRCSPPINTVRPYQNWPVASVLTHLVVAAVVPIVVIAQFFSMRYQFNIVSLITQVNIIMPYLPVNCLQKQIFYP